MRQLHQLKADLENLANSEKAKVLSRFFKTGEGQYGEGDIFLGIMVPGQRRIAKKYPGLSLIDIETLLLSRLHEHRLVALLILIAQYKEADEPGKERIVAFYLRHTHRINNWDLVDISAPYILGEHVADGDAAILSTLASSGNLWERRIAIMATFAFIRRERFKETLEIAEMLLHDRHDLIHKAVGWMLREVGKRDITREEDFLERHAVEMPRTMLRYAVERFEEKKRKRWLSMKRRGS